METINFLRRLDMSKNNDNQIKTAISPGELLDKISILEIKNDKITDSGKRQNVSKELDILTQTKSKHIRENETISHLYQKLKEINLKLWTIEDDIRDCERNKDFSDTFVQLARAVYITNDDRAAVKKEINLFLGSQIVEEKSYASY